MSGERRGRGRPEIGPAVNVRISTGLLRELEDWAAENGEPRAGAIRILLEYALGRLKGQSNPVRTVNGEVGIEVARAYARARGRTGGPEE